MLWRLAWFGVAASAVSFSGFLVAGNIAHDRAAGISQPVMIRDVFGRGVHHLSGMIMVPTPCDELFVHTQAVSSTTFMLFFNTWHEPSIDCAQNETPRPFHETFFAPAAGITFVATLDGAGLPIAVLPVVPLVPVK